MARIHQLKIRNYRGIKDFAQFFDSNFICLIGRGDSGKSTILDAISFVLSPNWNLQFFDNDFFNCNTIAPIEIEVTLTDLPDELLREDNYGLYQRGLDPETKEIHDEIEEHHESALTVKLEVNKDLEPHWSVITEREIGSKPISAADRGRFNVFLVADYIDRHFSWNRGNPLYSLLQQEETEDDGDGSHMIDALRDAKAKIDTGGFSKFDIATNKVKVAASTLGINISKTVTTIDFRDLVSKDGKLYLHDEKIPFRLKGKGSKRLISFAIQSAIAKEGGIALIDEIEQGLEPDRVQQLVNSLKSESHGQVFVTTHSRDVLVELSAENIYLVRSKANGLTLFDANLQGLLRSNPESFFAKHIIVCEGPTEIGICRALNEYRIANVKKNMAYLGIRLANGGGCPQMVEYTKGLLASGFPVCLFCDSDHPKGNAEKPALITKGATIVDWDNNDYLELAILRDLPFELVIKAFDLAAVMKQRTDPTVSIEDAKSHLWDSVKTRLNVKSPPENIGSAKDSIELRAAIASAASKNSWFKSAERASQLGKLIFDNFEKIHSDCKLKKQLTALSTWIDSHEA